MKKLSQKSNLPVLFALAVSFNPEFVKKTDTCSANRDPKTQTVYIVKQWHLSPSVNTKMSPPTKPLPQTKNQTEIYQQLLAWVNAKDIDTAIAEGCEGEINDSLKDAFQGWTYADLVAQAKEKNFTELNSHAVLKAKAKEPKALNAVCGDNLAEIKKSELALSDARADIGYFTRISENSDQPKKLKPYLDGVIEAYHLKPGTTALEAQNALALDLKTSVGAFQDSTHARDLALVKKITSVNSMKPTVLVVGGVHTADLKKILEAQKLNCVIFEPVSYQNDEEQLSSKLKAIIK